MSQVDVLPPITGVVERCWLKWPDTPQSDDRPAIRWTSKGGSEGSLELAGLTGNELDAMEGFLNGTSYVRCIDGRLHAYHAHEPLPPLEADPLIGPHWESTAEHKEFGGIPTTEGWHSPGLVITGLGAGIREPDDRLRNMQTVMEFGFVCLRSQRGDDGKYWEQWVLHFLEAARGRLQEHLAGLPDKEKDWHTRANAAAKFVAERVHFGSLDITIQRWALCID